MKLVLDASVAVAAVRAMEPTYTASSARVARLISGADEMVVPAIFPVEVASALTRAGWDHARVSVYLARLLAGAVLVTIGPRAAAAIVRVATQTRLRAADATYAWVARREGVPLVHSDAEVLQRGSSVCASERP